VYLGSLSLADALFDANPARLHPTFDKTVFPDNNQELSDSIIRVHLDLVERNIMDRYRGLATIFSTLYLIDGRILDEKKSFLYWNGT
jgi:hypothetical protein